MVICFECPERIKILLDRLVARGHYVDYNEVLVSAVQNLSVLQSKVSERGSLVLPSSHQRNVRTAATHHQSATSSQPLDVLSLARLPTKPPGPLAAMPANEWSPSDEVPVHRWIFGQYNRLLPAKASCRGLANLLLSEPRGLPLKEVAERLAEEARLLGVRLREHDEEHGIERDDAISTGFPTEGPGLLRVNAAARYANQFVGHMNKGKYCGLLADLKLANLVSEEPVRVSLTEAGWQFALLRNPVLDGEPEHARQKLSLEEVDFLIDHIMRYVPAERFAYSLLLGLIESEAYTPGDLDAALQGRFSNLLANGRYSDAFLSSQRSGAISRMCDLGLIARIRNGKRVTYNVLKLGKELVSRSSAR